MDEMVEELVFLKLGGSLLTDKTRPQALRPAVLDRLAREIASALQDRPGLRLLVGHGSGSYGHVAAREYGTRAGVSTAAEWRGYARTALAAGQLNRCVLDALATAGVPVLPVQPSASAHCSDGQLQSLDDRPVYAALVHGLVPVVYGDVALDTLRGGTIISTEEIFAWLAPRLTPQRIILVGEVPGVLTRPPASVEDPGIVVPELTPGDWPRFASSLGGSHGVDVTGGMLAKVSGMLELVKVTPELTVVHLLSGLVDGLVSRALCDPTLVEGTRLHR